MICSVTTVATREQKHYSFLPEEQIILKFSGNDWHRIIAWHFCTFLPLSSQSEIKLGLEKNRIFWAAPGAHNGIAIATCISGFLGFYFTQGELLWYASVRQPCVCPSVNFCFKQLLQNCWTDFRIISQKCSLGDPLSKLLKLFLSIAYLGHWS